MSSNIGDEIRGWTSTRGGFLVCAQNSQPMQSGPHEIDDEPGLKDGGRNTWRLGNELLELPWRNLIAGKSN